MRKRSYRAAVGQTRHWRLQQQQPASAALNIGFALHLEGPVDVGALDAALRELVERHGVLRSAFALRDGELWIDERPSPGWRLPLRALPEGGRDAADAALGAEAAAPFDLSEAVFRALLVRSAPLASLGLVFHHSVFDGWSFNVFFGQLAALYNAYAAGLPSPLAQVPARTYADFAAWQGETLASGAWDGQLDHWREELRDVEPGPTLPRDGDAGEPPHPVALAAVTLTVESSRLVKQTASRYRALPFAVLLAAYEAALAVASGRGDVVIGCPFVGRRHSEWRETIGLFVNTVPLRADLRDDPTLGDVVPRVRAALRSGHANQDVPLDRVMAEILDTASFSGLFDTLAQMQSAHGAIPGFDGLTSELVPLWNVHTKYDLLVSFGQRRSPGERRRSLVALFEYNADAFREATVLDFAARWVEALDALCRQPELRISELARLERLAPGEWASGFGPVRARDIPAVGLRSVEREVDLLAARAGV